MPLFRSVSTFFVRACRHSSAVDFCFPFVTSLLFVCLYVFFLLEHTNYICNTDNLPWIYIFGLDIISLLSQCYGTPWPKRFKRGLRYQKTVFPHQKPLGERFLTVRGDIVEFFDRVLLVAGFLSDKAGAMCSQTGNSRTMMPSINRSREAVLELFSVKADHFFQFIQGIFVLRLLVQSNLDQMAARQPIE